MKDKEIKEMLERIGEKQPELKDECMSCIELLECVKTLPEVLPEPEPIEEFPF